jgi:hypothetical protein
MTDIYKQHDAAFARTAAYVIAKDGERVGTIAFKYPQDGAGRLWVYVHYFGHTMARGYAGGYGYDKASAAVQDAVEKCIKENKKEQQDAGAESFYGPLAAMNGGIEWADTLRTAGFQVWKAV